MSFCVLQAIAATELCQCSTQRSTSSVIIIFQSSVGAMGPMPRLTRQYDSPLSSSRVLSQLIPDVGDLFESHLACLEYRCPPRSHQYIQSPRYTSHCFRCRNLAGYTRHLVDSVSIARYHKGRYVMRVSCMLMHNLGLPFISLQPPCSSGSH